MALQVQQIGKELNEEMLKILMESPMENEGLSLCLDRSPDIFQVPELFFDDYKAYGFFKDDQLVGYGMICEKELIVQGKPKLVGYFANLYVKKEARKLGWLYKASQPLFQEIMEKTNLGFATTVEGNRATEKMIGRRISKFPLMPFSETIGLYLIQNILVTTRKRPKTHDPSLPRTTIRGLKRRTRNKEQRTKRGSFLVRRADFEDFEGILELLKEEYNSRLFGVVLDEGKLREVISKRIGFEISDYYVAESGGELIGVCSAWDVKDIRKVRVLEYRKSYLWVYRAYSFLRPLFGFPMLPARGEPFKELIVNEFACKDRNTEIFRSLLTTVYSDARKKGYNMIQVGSYAGDPMLNATKKFFSQPLYSHIIIGSSEADLVKKEDLDITRPYIDIALT